MAAAAASEVAKDNHYLDSVTNDGASIMEVTFHSIPLVCESFGVWSPFALSTLFKIADHTTVKNGLSQKLARRQLLQRLSVTLWKYNAKMVLRYYALCSEDTIDFV